MGVYDNQIALALRMIKAKGQEVTWIQPGAPSGTDGMPGPNGDPVEFPGTPVLFLPSRGGGGLGSFLSVLAGTEVPSGGIRGLMAPVPFVPSLLDTVLRGTETLVLLRDNGIEQLAPNGEVILYMLRFAR